MTGIKRSFSLLVTLLLMLSFLPMFRIATEAPLIKSQSSSLTNTVFSGVLTSTNPEYAKMKETANSIKTIAEIPKGGTVSNAQSTALAPIAEISKSMEYKVAVDYTTPVSITDNERYLIEAIVQLEVIGKYSDIVQFKNQSLKYYEMLAVAQVIRNRLNNPLFPSTITEIINSHSVKEDGSIAYQFSTYPLVYGTNPCEAVSLAVSEVFDEGASVLPEDFMYFCAKWREKRFEQNNKAVLRYLGKARDYDKIIADATVFYAGITIAENKANGYVF